MDVTALLSTWFWYVMAFAAGMVVAWLVARQLVPATSPREAIDLAVDKELDDRAAARHHRPVGSDEAYDDAVEVQR